MAGGSTVAIHHDIIDESANRVETDRAGPAARALVIIGGDNPEGTHGVTSANRQQSIKVTADRGENEAPGGRCDPPIPDRPACWLVGVGGFRGFFSGADITPEYESA